ncbi:MAG: FHA domain-containing protein [Caldilineaceae bacterium]|nr:FHA domain-containing protein [Caldilineaceae bacterium]
MAHHGTGGVLLAGRLIAVGPDVEPPEYVLDADRCELGRSPLRDIVVADRTVSRLHAVIERQDERYLLRDAGSANGTFVNGQRLTEPHLLQDRDTIGLGTPAARLRYVDPDPTFIRPHETEPHTHGLEYDEARLRFALDGVPLELPSTQFHLLLHLYRQAGQVCSRESCAQAVWGRSYDPALDAGALDKIVSKLRQRLAAARPGGNDLIQVRRGVGYWLEMEDETGG